MHANCTKNYMSKIHTHLFCLVRTPKIFVLSVFKKIYKRSLMKTDLLFAAAVWSSDEGR